jgi:hypothetical protein
MTCRFRLGRFVDDALYRDQDCGFGPESGQGFIERGEFSIFAAGKLSEP